MKSNSFRKLDLRFSFLWFTDETLILESWCRYPTVDPYPDQLRRRFRRLRPHSPVCAIEPGLLTSFLMVARRESPLPAATQPCLVSYMGRRRRMLSSSIPNAAELRYLRFLSPLHCLTHSPSQISSQSNRCCSCRCSLMLHMSVSFGKLIYQNQFLFRVHCLYILLLTACRLWLSDTSPTYL